MNRQNPVQRVADMADALKKQTGTTVNEGEFYIAVADSLKMLSGAIDRLLAMLNSSHSENRSDLAKLTLEIRKLNERLDKEAAASG